MLFKFLVLLCVIIYVKSHVPLDTSCAANSLARTVPNYNSTNFAGKWYLVDRSYSDLAIGDSCSSLDFIPLKRTDAQIYWTWIAGNGSTASVFTTVVKSSVPNSAWNYKGNVNPGVPASVYVLSRTPALTEAQNVTINKFLQKNKQNRALFLPVINTNCKG